MTDEERAKKAFEAVARIRKRADDLTHRMGLVGEAKQTALEIWNDAIVAYGTLNKDGRFHE